MTHLSPAPLPLHRKTIFFLFISALTLSVHVFAQQDTVLKKILSEKNDSVIVKLLNDKVWDLMYSDKTNCLTYGHKALEIATRTGNMNSLSDCYNTLGAYYMVIGDFSKSIEFHQKALSVRTRLNDRKGLMKTYNNLGGAYKYIGAHKKEIDYYFLALKMAEEFKDTVVLAAIMNNIGDAFGRQENYDKAIEYHNKTLLIREKQNDHKGMVSSLINLATMYYKKKDYSTSEKTFLKAQTFLSLIEDQYLRAIFHSNYAALLKDVFRFDEALSHINSSIKLHENIGNANGNLVNYINIAAVHESKFQFSQANAAYQKALALSASVGNLLWQRQSYLGLSTTWMRLGNFKEAYSNHLNYEKLKDSLNNSEIRTRVEELERRYSREKLESENQLLQRKNTIQRLESDQKGYVIAFLVVLFPISALLLFLFWRNYKFRQLLKVKQIAVQAEENERQRIAKDIHDELGSGLTKIRFMSELLKNESKDTSGAINTISETSNSLVENMRDLIWVMNPENATLDNLIARIREYSGQYVEEFNIDFEFIAPDVIPSLKITKEVNRNAFMVVKEALQNIVKHSGANKTTIKILVADELVIEISDNGNGDISEKKEGNGLRNMKHRILQLQGSFEIIPGKDKGTLLKITVPIC